MTLCACGCGKPTPIAKRTRPELDHVEGEPVKYARGHNRLSGTGKTDIFFNGDRWHVQGRDGHRYLWYRILMANEIGRPLRRDELVHHINGDPTDDRLENLAIVSPSEHVLLHIAQGDHPGFTAEARENSRRATTNRVELSCAHCGKVFTRAVANARPGGGYCSKPCTYAARRGVPRSDWALA